MHIAASNPQSKKTKLIKIVDKELEIIKAEIANSGKLQLWLIKYQKEKYQNF